MRLADTEATLEHASGIEIGERDATLKGEKRKGKGYFLVAIIRLCNAAPRDVDVAFSFFLRAPLFPSGNWGTTFP